MKWVRIDKVSAKLTYPADQELFKVFEKLTETKKQETFSLILLRHAKALPAGGDIKSDAARPLSDHGMKQSLVIVPTLESFGAQKAFSSTALRCLDTLAPFAEHTGIEVTPSEAISQDSWEAGETSGLRQLITDLVAAEESAIVCSHAPVLPDLAREIAAQTVSSPGRYLASAAELPTAAFSIFHISHESKDIVAVETYPIKA